MAGGSRSKKRRRSRKRNPASELTDDLLLEILARVSYRPLCRFRCVSTRWSALISDPDNRRKLPHTLAGFFYPMSLDPDDAGSSALTTHDYGFLNVSGTGPPLIDPSFSFLPDSERERLELVDCCNGLILCRTYRFADNLEFEYLVLNPATEKWPAVPITRRLSNKVRMVHLGFDPAVTSHFHIFEFQLNMDDEDEYYDEDSHVLGVKIYSSATGVWINKQSDWSMKIVLQIYFKSVFLDGVLFVIAMHGVIGAVDVEGRTWRTIEFPHTKDSPFYDTAAGFIALSQGRLHLANYDHMVRDKLAIWVLGDKDSKEWTLKQTVRFNHLVGMKHSDFGFHHFTVVAIHPDRNMIFFVFGLQRSERTVMSYDMDSRKESIIRGLGYNEYGHFVPYVPLFSKSLPDGGN